MRRLTMDLRPCNVQRGDDAMIRLLLAERANVEMKTENDMTELYVAARDGHEGVVQLMLEMGANIEVTAIFFSSSPLSLFLEATALQIAAGYGHERK